jgi:hypothetical protein
MEYVVSLKKEGDRLICTVWLEGRKGLEKGWLIHAAGRGRGAGGANYA